MWGIGGKDDRHWAFKPRDLHGGARVSRPKGQGRQLVEDCEAFLTGHFVERRIDRGAEVPAWAWTNLLAHGSEEALRVEREASETRRVTVREQWREARSYLAAEVLDLAVAHGPLAELQRIVLSPLELELVHAGYMAPRRWVETVEGALEAYRRDRRRAESRDSHPRG